MDRSRFKRAAIKKQHQTANTTLGIRPTVARAMPTRPLTSTPMRPTRPQQPLTPRRPADIIVAKPQPVQAPLAAKQPLRPRQPRVNDMSIRRPSQATQAQVGKLAASNSSLTATEKLARKQPIDMDLPGENSESHFSKFFRRTKWQRVRRLTLKTAAVGLVLVITIGGLLFSQGFLQLNKVFRGGAGTAAALDTKVDPGKLKGEGRGRVNILLMGRGGGTHEAPDLTDTLMVASVDPVNNTATLLSLPRDLWVNVPEHGVMKLNAAWQSGAYRKLGKQINNTTDSKAIEAGYKSLDKTVQEVTGLEIDYHILVNFQAFKQAIDTVGGVTVNVPADLVDPTMAWENKNDPVLARAGPQTFDGYKALMYSRSRETSSDFARGERQRSVLVALKSKIVSKGTLSNPAKLSRLSKAFGDNVQTDLSMKNASRLYTILKKINDTKVTSISLADPNQPLVTTGNANGLSVVLPKDGLFKYDAIQQYVRGQLKDPYIVREKATIMLLNGTLNEGLATVKANELKSYGYNVINVGNTPGPGWTTTTVVDMTRKNKFTKNYLERRFGQTAATQLGDSSIATNGADFVIILGSDQATPQ